MLVGLCRGLSGLWQRTWQNHLSLTLFDPVLFQSGSNDCRVDLLVKTCAALTAHGLVELVDGGLSFSRGDGHLQRMNYQS